VIGTLSSYYKINQVVQKRGLFLFASVAGGRSLYLLSALWSHAAEAPMSVLKCRFFGSLRCSAPKSETSSAVVAATDCSGRRVLPGPCVFYRYLPFAPPPSGVLCCPVSAPAGAV